jgi:hypothetical protein
VSGAPQLGAGAAVGTLEAATGVAATIAGAMRPAVAAAERVTRLGEIAYALGRRIEWPSDLGSRLGDHGEGRYLGFACSAVGRPERWWI